MTTRLAGLDTEFGLLIEGRGAETQVEDATAFVQAFPDYAFVGWDYRFENPRADLRGFQLDRLAIDPEDAQYDRGRSYGPAHEVRADRVLPNGARFYNDHGHPEYATPECLTLRELALHDLAGEQVLLRTARAFSERIEREVRIYKNNTDYHGASFGSHEGYLVPRALGFTRLFADLLPMLIARTVLTGAGKVGSEVGAAATYQLSQRADFFVEPANAETLYRRPIFNTRDEPHAEPEQWIRLHVISGDANMMPEATMRKVGLVRLALALCESGTAPLWRIQDPVRQFQAISRDESYRFAIALEGGSWTTAREVLESYFASAEATLDLSEDARWTIDTSRELLGALTGDFSTFRKHVDWAAKRHMLESFMAEEDLDWRDPSLRAYDLEYHNIDPEAGLYHALVEMGEVATPPPSDEVEARRERVFESVRARARGTAVSRFAPEIVSIGWRALTLRRGGEAVTLDLAPDGAYPSQLEDASDVGTFISLLRGDEHA